MFKKALIATDASAASLAVVNCANGLKGLGVQECILAQCFSIREHVAFPEQIAKFLKEELDSQKSILEKNGINTTVVVEPGLPGKTIPRLAKENDCGLIVIGSQGRNFAAELFMGGTATEILHNMTKPVLVIPIRSDEETGQLVCSPGKCNFLDHVIFPTDFSNHARFAFESVKRAVEEGAKRVTLLHIQDKSKIDKHLEHQLEEFNKIDNERLNDHKNHLTNLGKAHVEIEIVYGSPSKTILEKSQEGASLIIMGSHGKGFVSDLFIGSISHNVARNSKVPVLIVPMA
jgi:nucleotide-binding universal stress UspA family protein